MGEHPHTGLTGKWRGILAHDNDFTERQLSGRPCPCPFPQCGGTDRFRFDDKGEGRYYCQHCGAGDGFGMLMKKHGLSFVDAMAMARSRAGMVQAERPRREADTESKRRALARTWKGGSQNHADARAYFSKRGIEPTMADDPVLRWHHNLPWMVPDEAGVMRKGSNPALLARYFQWDQGKPVTVTLHRIWPQGCPRRKMVMPPIRKMNGVFCPLGGPPTAGEMGIAEGVESACSLRQLLLMVRGVDIPVWSVYSAEQMIKFQPPPGLQLLHVGMDVDYSYTGQAAAYELARRLRVSHPSIELNLIRPSKDGSDCDFNDRLRSMAT